MSKKKLKYTVSNHYEYLEKKLWDDFTNNNLIKKIIVTEQDSLERRILKTVTKSQSFFGIKVMPLHRALDFALKSVSLDKDFSIKLPTPSLLAFHLECLIEEALEKPNEKGLESLIKHLQSLTSFQKKKRVKEISETLAKVFIKLGTYSLHGADGVFENDSFQKVLWDKVLSFWDMPYQLNYLLRDQLQCRDQVSFYFFGYSHMPKVIEEFFLKLGPEVSLNFYELSPSSYYFGDQLTKKQSVKVLESIGKKQFDDAKELFQAPNYLLANWGQIFSKRQKEREEKEADVQEEYLIRGGELIDPFIFESHKDTSSLLERLQEDILLMKQNPKISIKTGDRSFECHSCSSLLREVEVVKDRILTILEETDIKPEDIAIYAPDITIYHPYLNYFFELEEPKLFLDVYGLQALYRSQFLQKLLQVFGLRRSKLTRHELFDLLQDQVFGFSKEDLLEIEQLVERAGVRYGFSKEHKSELISTFSEELYEAKAFGSWIHGFQRLLLGLFSNEPLEFYEETMIPEPGLDFSKAEKFGEFVDFLFRLFNQLESFKKEKHSISSWCHKIESFVEQFFTFGEDIEGQKLLFDQLAILGKFEEFIGEKKLSFDKIESYLKKSFLKKAPSHLSALGKIYVNSLKPGLIQASRVTCLLGLNDGFPKVERDKSYSKIPRERLEGCFKTQEEDKHAVLEALISTRDSLILSHQKKPDQGIGQSTLLEELLIYLDTHYMIGDKKISDARCFTHSAKGFDPGYFSNKELLTFSEKNAKMLAAKTLSHDRKVFIQEFYESKRLEMPTEYQEVIKIENLVQLCKNSLAFFLKKALNIYPTQIRKESELFSKEFFLSHLERYLLAKSPECDRAVNIRHLEGKIPEGIFQEIALRQVFEKADEKKELLKGFGLEDQRSWTIHLVRGLKETQRDELERCLYVKAPEVSVLSKHFIIEGTLRDVYEKGMIFEKDTKKHNLFGIWPAFLVFNLLDECEFLSKKLLILKNEEIKTIDRTKASQALKDLVEYYLLASSHISPLLPTVMDAFFEKDEKLLDKHLNTLFSLDSSYKDDYLGWMTSQMPKFSSKALIDNWSSVAIEKLSVYKSWEKGELV